MTALGEIVGISVVKNEADIIEPMVRHNLQFLDSLVIVDNNSGDRTADIIASLRDEYPGRLLLRRDLRTGHLQQEILNSLITEFGEQPGIICFVPLDADEMIRADIEDFRRCLLSESRPVLLPWVTYVPTAADDPAVSNPIVRIGHRRIDEVTQYYKTTFPRQLAGQTLLAAGSHALLRKKKFNSVVIDGLSLAHFPLRTRDQLWAKAVIGALNMRIRTGSERQEGFQWHRLFDQILSSGGLSDAQFFAEAARYALKKQDVRLVHDPLPVADDARVLRHQNRAKDLLAIKLTSFAAECVDLLRAAKDRPES